MHSESRLLNFHQWQGKSNDCGPFTTAIVLNTFRGEKIFDGKTLAQEMNRPRLKWYGLLPFILIRRIPDWATMPWGIADTLTQHGVRARWRFGATKDDLLNALNQNRVAMPIIGEINLPRKLWAHVKPLAQYDRQSGFGFVDPAHPTAEIVWQNENEFAGLWRNWRNLLVETL